MDTLVGGWAAAPSPPRYALQPTRPTGARVAAAYGAALRDGGSAPLTELRAATLAFSATLRAEGRPPEQTLISLKAALAQTRPISLVWACSSDDAQAAEHRIYAHVFRWYLEGYFGRLRSRDVSTTVTWRVPLTRAPT